MLPASRRGEGWTASMLFGRGGRGLESCDDIIYRIVSEPGWRGRGGFRRGTENNDNELLGSRLDTVDGY